ncbi:HDOD domain-containing protein [Hydrogenimonas thermophila]|uniref:HDOD domain-containing protein n=1 Tax=Hydrogenimonas thermophila TaxID=223786 RepID=UPI002936E675|nr:HDOD domain-containing protein [Hydrogenimonas thermophila]WOE70045.1 HDOD domain-containing protein [Hydrogenimonas thermophila]WOE72562.1 HDOD domain-containing protein [Hydrogenimonas thermophila]
MPNKILNYVQSFPPIPDTILSLEKAINEEKPNRFIADIIKKDPMLQANILKTVNAPYFGLRSKVNSVEQAIAILGLTIIKGIVLTAIIKKFFTEDIYPYPFSIYKISEISLKRIKLAEKIFDEKIFNNIKQSICFLELGKIVFSPYIKKYMKNKFLLEIENRNIEDIEKDLTGYTSYELVAELFKKWNFPNEIYEPIKFCYFPEQCKNYAQESKYLNILITIIPIHNQQNIDQILKIENELGIKIKDIGHLI